MCLEGFAFKPFIGALMRDSFGAGVFANGSRPTQHEKVAWLLSSAVVWRADLRRGSHHCRRRGVLAAIAAHRRAAATTHPALCSTATGPHFRAAGSFFH